MVRKMTGINEVGNKVPRTTQTNSDAKQIVSQPSGDVKIKLSLQETSDAAKAREELLNANDNLRVANTVLKNELKTTHGKSISIKDAEKRINYNDDYRKSIRPDIDRSDVIFVDGAEESYSLEDIDKYTEKEYNDYGWVAVNDVLSGYELSSLNHQLSNLSELKFNYPKTKSNEYMIIVSDSYDSYGHLVYIKGTASYPKITKVVGVVSEYKNHTEACLMEVIKYEQGEYNNPIRYLEDYAGKELFYTYTFRDNNSYYEIKAERSRTESFDNNRGKQNGSGSSGKNSGLGIKPNLQETSDAAKAREELLKVNDNLRVANTVLTNKI